MLQVDLACFLDTSIVEVFTEMLILCVTIFIGIFYEISCMGFAGTIFQYIRGFIIAVLAEW